MERRARVHRALPWLLLSSPPLLLLPLLLLLLLLSGPNTRAARPGPAKSVASVVPRRKGMLDTVTGWPCQPLLMLLRKRQRTIALVPAPTRPRVAACLAALVQALTTDRQRRRELRL
jgi:hypothetical protein